MTFDTCLIKEEKDKLGIKRLGNTVEPEHTVIDDNNNLDNTTLQSS